MPSPSRKILRPAPAQAALRIGFIALNDAAPIIVAQEHGLFKKHGLCVTLSREVGWATIRDKVIHHELDAAHALGAMLISTQLGINCLPTDCLTAFVLNANGNCITLSVDLWRRGVRDAATLRDEIVRSRHERTYVFGVVFAHSAQRIQLSDWLRSGGIDPEKDVRIVVVPPPQLFRNLAAGTIDGYCVGDPWNSLAVRENIGWCPDPSLTRAPEHAEKVLMVLSDFAHTRADEHLALISALGEAAELCDRADFRPELCDLLARKEYLNVPSRVIQSSLVGPFDAGHKTSFPADDFIHFHRNGANDPTAAKAAWLIEGFKRNRFLPAGMTIPANLGQKTFRSDLHHLALQTV
jgi:ABC-type nitrate/sulfonate/bicarbonate transport system substrate-binding protein